MATSKIPKSPKVLTINKTSNNNGLVHFTASDFDVTKPYAVLESTDGYFYPGADDYFRLTDYVGNPLYNRATTFTVLLFD